MAKLTSKIARGFVERIEELNDQISAVYREVSEYDGYNNVNAIREIVTERAAAEEHKFIADGTLEGFDVEDETD